MQAGGATPLLRRQRVAVSGGSRPYHRIPRNAATKYSVEGLPGLRARRVSASAKPLCPSVAYRFASPCRGWVVLPSVPQRGTRTLEASPSPVYGARLLSGLRAQPSRGFKSRRLRSHQGKRDRRWSRPPGSESGSGALVSLLVSSGVQKRGP
jgi:hypothetical protein